MTNSSYSVEDNTAFAIGALAQTANDFSRCPAHPTFDQNFMVDPVIC